MSDLERLLDLQRSYTSLQFEVIRFYEIVLNKKMGNDITVVEFEDPFLNDACKMINEHATWNKDKDERTQTN